MKKNQKTGLRMLLMLGLALMLSGCGKSDEMQEKATGEVYVPEYVQLELDCDYITQTVSDGEAVFLCTTTYDEETGQSNYAIYRYDLNENTSNKIPFELEENSYVQGMIINAEGNLMLLSSYAVYHTDEEGAMISAETGIVLSTIAPEQGTVISSIDLTEMLGGTEAVYIQYFQTDSQGNLYLCDGENTIHVLSRDMQKTGEITLEDWIYGMTASKEGEVYISTYGESGIVLKKVDPVQKSLGEPVSGMTEEFYGNGGVYTGSRQSFLINTGSRLLTYDLQTQTEETVFEWLDVDVNSDNIANTGELSDGRVWALSREYGESETSYELIVFQKKNAAEVAQKEEIVFGTLWLDSDLKKSIIDFNKTNQQYRITVTEYAAGDYEAGLARFQADVTSGNCPDMIDLSSLDFEQYAGRGILEDLYPYMEQSQIKQEDYLQNILKAYEMDGSLYGIIPEFYLSTTIAKTSLVGEKEGWTLSEMLDFVEEKDPENVFQFGTRAGIFYYCVYHNMNEFINWETGECSFDSDAFIRTLTFAAAFPEEADYNTEQEGISSMLREDKILLMQDSLSSVQEFQMIHGLFGEAITYIGYPNSERKGNLIVPTGGCVAMSAKSEQKDGVWEFMQIMLSEEHQDSLVSEYGGWGFPVKISALEKQFELDMTPSYYEDEEGNKIENPKTTWGYDDFEMDIMAATQEEVDQVRSLLMSAEKIAGNGNEQMINMITEEAEPFFKGQKSAAEAAAVIQNRIQIYVNENR